MDPQFLQLIGSLAAILMLAGVVWALKLGRAPAIADGDHAMVLAREADTAFEPVFAEVSADGAAAIIADPTGRIMVLRRHGAQFAARVLGPGAHAQRANGVLTVDPVDRRFGQVTLNLGNKAQAWESRINALDGYPDA